MAKLQVIKTTGSFFAGFSFGLGGCVFSSKKYRRGRLSYGRAAVHSFDSNGLTGKSSKGKQACEIPSKFL
jgi:hypothetical protein